MNMFAFFLLQAPSQTGGAGSFLIQFFPFILIFGVFYFLIIVPQRKRQRELQQTVASLKAGDRIITTGGILATVTSVRDASLIVRSADKTMLEISRASVAGLQAEEEKK
ncbi:MAG: preprotein translocase subunit YajC [Pyrinomonadaceae bacterium]